MSIVVLVVFKKIKFEFEFEVFSLAKVIKEAKDAKGKASINPLMVSEEKPKKVIFESNYYSNVSIFCTFTLNICLTYKELEGEPSKSLSSSLSFSIFAWCSSRNQERKSTKTYDQRKLPSFAQ